MENQAIKPQIMMPAIYKLDTGNPKTAHWGWHKASELLEALQSILASQGKPILTADEICAQYPHLHPNGCINERDPDEPIKTYLLVTSDMTCYEARTDQIHWLQRHADKGEYIPAKIGMALIKAIKHPLLDRIARVVA